jgi:spore coat protein U-like protein
MGASNYMNYNIFLNSGRTTIWNTTNVSSSTSTSRFTPLGGGLVGYGRVPAGQDIAIGAYSDTITATVNY